MNVFKIGCLIARMLMFAAAATLCTVSIRADPPTGNAAKILPKEIGAFRQAQPSKATGRLTNDRLLRTDYFPASTDPKAAPPFVTAIGTYSSGSDEFQVEVVQFQSDSEAYALLTLAALTYGKPASIHTGDPGTAHVVADRGIAFFKGTTFALITAQKTGDEKSLSDFARLLAATIDEGEGDLPVLVKHLPDWQDASAQAVYTVSLAALRDYVPNQPVLDAVSFEGGTEAVAAKYGSAQLVIVEFSTPQFSVDNDQKIWTRIAESKSKGETVPNAYRRVGNYSVFVFNAPDEKTANALIDQVKYEKVVQWLGEDPHLYERLQRYFTQTSAGVLVAVLKSSGLSLVLCLVAGALIGTMMFRHRRTHKSAAYSDAGGSIRLNLDELTAPPKTDHLLKGVQPAQRNSVDT